MLRLEALAVAAKRRRIHAGFKIEIDEPRLHTTGRRPLSESAGCRLHCTFGRLRRVG